MSYGGRRCLREEGGTGGTHIEFATRVGRSEWESGGRQKL